MATDAKKITCRRCCGKGFLPGRVVVYAGAPGTCFMCAGAGTVYADKFHRSFPPGARIVGITRRVWLNPDNPNNGVFKSIGLLGDKNAWEIPVEAAIASGDFFPCWEGRMRVVELTEAQARAFVEKFGAEARLRVGDTTEEDGRRSAPLAAA